MMDFLEVVVADWVQATRIRLAQISRAKDDVALAFCSGLMRGLEKMAAEESTESYLELYDFAKKETVATTPLAGVRFIPRIGERIFIARKGPRNWDSYSCESRIFPRL